MNRRNARLLIAGLAAIVLVTFALLNSIRTGSATQTCGRLVDLRVTQSHDGEVSEVKRHHSIASDAVIKVSGKLVDAQHDCGVFLIMYDRGRSLQHVEGSSYDQAHFSIAMRPLPMRYAPVAFPYSVRGQVRLQLVTGEECQVPPMHSMSFVGPDEGLSREEGCSLLTELPVFVEAQQRGQA